MKLKYSRSFCKAIALVGLLPAMDVRSQTNPDPGSGEVTSFVLLPRVYAGDPYDPLVALPGRDSYVVQPDRTGVIRLDASLTHTFSGSVTITVRDADGVPITSSTGNSTSIDIPAIKYRFPLYVVITSPTNEAVFSGTLIYGDSGYTDGPGYVGNKVTNDASPDGSGEESIAMQTDEGGSGEDGKDGSGACGSCSGSSCDLSNSNDTENADASGDNGNFFAGFSAGSSAQGDSSSGVDAKVDPNAGVSRSSFKAFGTGDALISRDSNGNLVSLQTSTAYTKFDSISGGVQVSISKTPGSTVFRTICFLNSGTREVTRTSTFSGKTITTVWKYNPTTKTWSIVTDNGLRKHEVIREDNGSNAALRVERHKYYERASGATGDANVLVSDVRKTFTKTILGWKKTKAEVLGLTGNPLTTIWEYYGPADGADKAGLLKSVVRSDGSSETHTYSNSGDYYHFISRPFADGTTSVTETRQRTISNSGAKIRIGLGTNYETSREDYWSGNELIRKTDTGSGQTEIRYTVKPFGSDFGGCPTIIKKPDGTGTTQTLTRTGLGSSDFRNLTTTCGLISGGAVTQGEKTETSRDKNGGVICMLKTAVGTGSGTVLDSWVVTNSDSLGRATAIDYFPGSSSAAWTISRTYECCGLASETDKFGVVTYYAYDDVGRRVRRNRQGVTRETRYDGLTIHKHRYAGSAAGGIWTGSASGTNEISNLVRDISGTLKIKWGRSPQTEGGTHNGASIVDANPDQTPPVYSSSPDDFSVTQTVMRNPAAASPNPGGLPPGVGRRQIVTYVRCADDDQAPNQTNDYFLDGKLKETYGDMAPHVRHSYVMNATGLCVTQEYVMESGSGAETVITQYDLAGRIQTVTQASSVTTRIYGTPGSGNGAGKLVKIVDADGVTTMYAYNTEGELTTTAVDENGNGSIDFSGTDRVTVTEASPGSYCGYDVVTTTTTVYSSDGSGSSTDNAVTVHRSTDGLRNWTLRFGDSTATSTVTIPSAGANRTFTTTDSDGTIHRQYYENGRLIAETAWESGSTPPATAPADITVVSTTGFVSGTAYAYDSLGRKKLVTDSRTGVVTTDYVSATCDFVRSITDAGERQNLFTYDHRGRRKSLDAPDTIAYDGTSYVTNGNVTLTNYYANGRVKEVLGDQVYRTSYSYDYAGRMTTMTTFGATPATTTWVYDNVYGRLVEKNYNGEADDPSVNPSDADYTYTNAGRLLTRKWERGVSTTYGYSSGLLTSINYSDETPDIVFTHDRLGRLRTVSQGSGGSGNTHTYSYNDDSNGGSGTLGHGFGIYSEAVFYGSMSLSRTLYRHTDDNLRTTGWELRNESSTETSASYGYDAAGRLNRVDPAFPLPISPKFTYSYEDNSFGMIHSVVSPVHTVTNIWESTSDDLNTKINEETSGAATVKSSYTYSINAIGQRDEVEVSGTAHGTIMPNRSWAYDKHGQIVLENNPSDEGYVREYGYDGIGNRTSSRNSDGVTSYNSGVDSNDFADQTHNQYYSITFPAASALEPSYDDDGNMRSGPIPIDLSANATLSWDAENRLIGITRVDSTVISYKYDYLGRRISKGVSSAPIETYFYDGWKPVARFVGGSLSNAYTWGMDISGTMTDAGGVGGLLADKVSTTVYYPTYDGNGNVTEYLDGNGEVAAHFEYDGFGSVVRCTESSSGMAASFQFRFSTKILDVESGYYYYGYRYYDPVIGRWTSMDPIGEYGGENLYGIVENNVVGNVDALGHKSWGRRNMMERMFPWYGAIMELIPYGDCECWALKEEWDYVAEDLTIWNSIIRDATEDPDHDGMVTVPETVVEGVLGGVGVRPKDDGSESDKEKCCKKERNDYRQEFRASFEGLHNFAGWPSAIEELKMHLRGGNPAKGDEMVPNDVGKRFAEVYKERRQAYLDMLTEEIEEECM